MAIGALWLRRPSQTLLAGAGRGAPVARALLLASRRCDCAEGHPGLHSIAHGLRVATHRSGGVKAYRKALDRCGIPYLNSAVPQGRLMLRYVFGGTARHKLSVGKSRAPSALPNLHSY
eukprot:365688-Chlamydomonas_euryale.AAC.3